MEQHKAKIKEKVHKIVEERPTINYDDFLWIILTKILRYRCGHDAIRNYRTDKIKIIDWKI